MAGLHWLDTTLDEEDALRQYVGLIRAQVRGYALTEPSLADDLLQTARIEFIRALREWEPETGEFETYAICCIRRRLCRYWARERRLIALPRWIGDYADKSTAYPDAILADDKLDREAAGSLEDDCVDRLYVEWLLDRAGEPGRSVMRLRCQDYTDGEIGRMMGVNEGSTRMRRHRARERLAGLVGGS